MATGLRGFLAGLLICTITACQSFQPPEPSTIYLVRHAEKVVGEGVMMLDDPRDPPLTEAGEQRAVDLAEYLSDVGIAVIWSSDYRRTRDTAAPLAEALGQDVQLYNPSDLEGFAEQLKAMPDQSMLVIGHSNTTPQLAEALGADPGTPIIEATEYDRLYVIELGTGKNHIQRFGVPSIIDAPDG